jgi:hypothetical protein
LIGAGRHRLGKNGSTDHRQPLIEPPLPELRQEAGRLPIRLSYSDGNGVFVDIEADEIGDIPWLRNIPRDDARAKVDT